MIATFRNLSKSKIGTAVLGIILLLIVLGFAAGDIQNVVPGNPFGPSQNAVAKVGGEEVTTAEFDSALRRRLSQLRQENPSVGNAALARDFDPLLAEMIDFAALRAFAADNDIIMSRRLIDAEIAKLPGTRGLDGRFTDQSYNDYLQRAQMTDAMFRKLIGDQLIQRMLLAPVTSSARVPIGIARPYAAMQMEQREADVALVPITAFAAQVGEPNDQQLAAFYQSNRARYTVPEQRILDIVRVGPEQVANLTPSDQEIAAYYNANRARYAGKAQKVISRIVLPSEQAAVGVAAQLRAGKSFVDVARPLGQSAADISLGPQTREEFARLTSNEAAAAVFAPNAGNGAIVGPLRTDLGFLVVKVDRVQTSPGRSLAQVRSEISAQLVADKRKGGLQDLIARLEDAIADGSSIAEAARAAGLTVVRTPAINAAGQARGDAAYKFPAELAPALKTGFQLDQGEEPAVVILQEGTDYALVGVDQIVAAAPAPLGTIRDRIVADWKAAQARDKARGVASAIAAKVARGVDVAKAVSEAGVKLPAPEKSKLRRIQLAQMGGNVPTGLKMMFSLAQGRSRMVADPDGKGFLVVKVTQIIPGDITLQPQLISQIQREFEQALGVEYTQQFTNAVRADAGVKRNEAAIAALKRQYAPGE
jgi:peptidyl-prolyl cis-trans isomerase D